MDEGVNPRCETRGGMELMTIYKENYPKTRYGTLDYPGYLGRQDKKHISKMNKLPAMRMLHSPSKFISSALIPPSNAAHLCDDYGGCFAMEKDVPTALRSINDSKLASIVRQSLMRENFSIQGWKARKLDGGVSNPVSLGLYRFEGVGVDQGEWLDWSIILKVIQSPANQGYYNLNDDNDPAHWNYWKRELLVYQSGWLENLPEGITAPHCYEAVELPENIAGIWLEDVQDSFAGNWPLYRYALTARHLGRLNGTYISRRELPSYPWLSRNRTRQWLSSIAWRDFPWDHPRARQQFPALEVNYFRQMLQDQNHFLNKLEQLPNTVSHGDTYPTNFKSRRSARNQEQTVAIDWAMAGIEPLGDDLGQLVYGTYMNLKGYKLHDISHTLFTSYVNGLEDSGCRVDPKWIRFGYTVSAALRVGLFKLLLLRQAIDKEEDFIPHIVSPPLVTDSFESLMAEEAYQLLDVI